MVQCSHAIMGLGCGYTGAAALVLGHYALLVAQIAQTVIVPAAFQSLLDVCVYVSDPKLACTPRFCKRISCLHMFVANGMVPIEFVFTTEVWK